MYKIINDKIIQKGTTFIPRDELNSDYQQFKADVVGIGTTCVEGATVEVTVDYKEARANEYPPLEDQLDKIFHDGIESWRTDIRAIKDKYPKTQVGITSISPLPQWVIDLTSS